MPVVVPFKSCIARPGDGADLLLSEHLRAVGLAWASGREPPCRNAGLEASGGCASTCTPVCSQFRESAVERALLFLGGLLHDAGKARKSWQDYVQAGAKSGPKIFHAPTGAALFYYLSFKLLTILDDQATTQQSLLRSRQLLLLRVKICLDIADHHGDLSNVDITPPWDRGGFSADHLSEMDLDGLSVFVSEALGYDLAIDLEQCLHYLGSCYDEWRRVSTVVIPVFRKRVENLPFPYAEAAKACLRIDTAQFIVGDRYHASGVQRSALTKEAAAKALRRLEMMLKAKALDAVEKGASAELVRTREEAQNLAVQEYARSSGGRMYRLCLPTGFGKTMAALRIALTSCLLRAAERIVYVAPYLSILSQATKEIREATGIDVLQHHHLSVIQNADLAEDDDLLLLESWQSPIVTTTFNQLFLALFPRRAQHTLRLHALRKAFIIIDEPQIIDKAAWKIFLQMLEALADLADATVLFTTATMPPTTGGLSKPPVDLITREFRLPPRYEVQWLKVEYGAHDIAQMVKEDLLLGKNVAVVMSTIKNAAQVYQALREVIAGDPRCGGIYFLSGAMVPVHKSAVIGRVKAALAEASRVAVVSTQVLEAGVDLSFERIYRENPIIPSIVQAAGRANRHGEKNELALVKVFNYVDEQGRSGRPYVYSSSIWREETDRLLDEFAGQWTEESTSLVLSSFYNACYERSPDEELLVFLIDAACGDWSKLKSVKPLDDDRDQVDVFVPWKGELPDYLKKAMAVFDIRTPDEIYDRYLDYRFLRNLSFSKRKLFMSILQSLSVPVSYRLARSIADSGGNRGIWRILDPEQYDCATGLSKVGVSDVSTVWI